MTEGEREGLVLQWVYQLLQLGQNHTPNAPI